MTNPFKDIDTFGSACDQEPSEANYKMYLGLIKEEYEELQEAVEANDTVEQLDALIDTNFAKINPETGKVRKREDGKVLKPEGWEPPQLAKFIGE